MTTQYSQKHLTPTQEVVRYMIRPLHVKSVGHKCPFKGVRQVQVVRKGTLLIDHTHKVISNDARFILSPAGCPTTRLTKTEYLDLFLSTSLTFPQTTDNLEIDY